MCALLPVSFFLAAPMSESLYLLLSLATLYAASRIDGTARAPVWIAAIYGALAALARIGGVAVLVLLLAGLAALFRLGLTGP